MYSMILSPYINELLFNHECVIIPAFGAFVSQEKKAALNTSKAIINPPKRVVSFNKLITTNDGLLINYISNKTKKDYNEVKQELQFLVNTWHNQLSQGDKISFEGIGILYKTNNQLTFEPSSVANFDKKAFGLATINANPVVKPITKPATVVSQTQTVATAPETSKKPYLKYAAAALIGFGLLAVSANWYTNSQRDKQQQEIAKQQQLALEKKIQTATIFVADETIPEVTISQKSSVEKENQANATQVKYHIIIGAFREKANALKQIQLLNKKGIEAAIIGINKYGLHQVAAKSTNDETEAINTLHKLQRTVSKSAWLYVNAN